MIAVSRATAAGNDKIGQELRKLSLTGLNWR